MKDGMSFEYFAIEAFYTWTTGFFAILAKYPKNMPRWANYWVPTFAYRDFQKRFLQSSDRSKVEITHAAIWCSVCAIAGVVLILYGADAAITTLIVGFASVVVINGRS